MDIVVINEENNKITINTSSVQLAKPALPLSSISTGVTKDERNHVIPAEDFQMTETVKRVMGDGGCLYRSLLYSIGLNEDLVQQLRNSIATWLENWILSSDSPGYEAEILSEIISTPDPESWGGELQIFAFEKMSGLRVVVYEEIVDPNGNAEFYVCQRGLEESNEKDRSNAVFLLWSEKSAKNSKSNHYDAINRVCDQEPVAMTFLQKYFSLDLNYSEDDLPIPQSPPRKKPERGYAKEAPTEWLQRVELFDITSYSRIYKRP